MLREKRLREVLMMPVAPEGAEAQREAAAELADGCQDAVVAVVDGAAAGDEAHEPKGEFQAGVQNPPQNSLSCVNKIPRNS